MSAFSATHLNTDKLAKVITQAGHGFDVGTIVIYDFGVTGYVRALADSEVNCSGAMMVSFYIDADTFAVTQCGYVYGLTLQDPYTVGAIMYVSPFNPGELTYTKPTAVGQVELECFYPISTTSGYFFGGSGDLVESGGLLEWLSINSNTVAVPNTGYININTGPGSITVTLPAAPATGDIVKINNFSHFGLVVDYAAGQSITLVDVTSTITTGNVTIDTTNGVLAGVATFTYQIVGNWLMECNGNWIVN
jgi:hypothetical protein